MANEQEKNAMNSRDVIKRSLKSTQRLIGNYLSDLSDADLLIRPAPTANHIAWQLGHLILAEQSMMAAQAISGASWPELPAGFKEQHSKEKAAEQSTKGFGTKADYLDLFKKTRAATIAALDNISDADLDKPTQGRMAEFAPLLADILLLQAHHTLMHAGQFTVVRRQLGKPVWM
jgi:uncharacterized damage-inducible protein DinB